jgi:hypothetical protein
LPCRTGTALSLLCECILVTPLLLRFFFVGVRCAQIPLRGVAPGVMLSEGAVAKSTGIEIVCQSGGRQAIHKSHADPFQFEFRARQSIQALHLQLSLMYRAVQAKRPTMSVNFPFHAQIGLPTTVVPVYLSTRSAIHFSYLRLRYHLLSTRSGPTTS